MSNPTTITVRRSEVDEWGDPLEPVEHTIDGCTVYPAESTTVDGRGQNGMIAGLTVLTPAGADIRHGDEVRVPAPHSKDPAMWWQVDGEAGEYVSPFGGWAPGGQVSLRRATG